VKLTQLRRPAVRDGMLAQSLAEAGKQFAAPAGVRFVVRSSGALPVLAPDVEEELFTIGREALSNAFRHAGARQVVLELACQGGNLRLAVSDDGQGIPPDILARGARQGHWGLPGMRERARLAGGALTIASTARGTTVSVDLLLPTVDAPVQLPAG
jgi:signal transduction histidine kinase